MDKYLGVFKISLQQESAYRINFIMWRARNIIQLFLLFFLWDSIFTDQNRELFGYDRTQILTYVFGIFIIRALVLSARAVDVAGEISSGNLTNYLLKPLNYFSYWLTRDLASKSLNIGFAAVETIILFQLLKPSFFLQSNAISIIGFTVSIILAILLFFSILMMTSSVTFWIPEMAWGTQFIVIVVIVEFLSGAMFPLDIFPQALQNLLYLTPFPYLLFFPLQVYLGKFTGVLMLKGIIISGVWLIILWLVLQKIWVKGLRAYRAEGR